MLARFIIIAKLDEREKVCLAFAFRRLHFLSSSSLCCLRENSIYFASFNLADLGLRGSQTDITRGITPLGLARRRQSKQPATSRLRRVCFSSLFSGQTNFYFQFEFFGPQTRKTKHTKTNSLILAAKLAPCLLRLPLLARRLDYSNIIIIIVDMILAQSCSPSSWPLPVARVGPLLSKRALAWPTLGRPNRHAESSLGGFRVAPINWVTEQRIKKVPEISCCCC